MKNPAKNGLLLCFDYDGVISDSIHQLLEVAKDTQKKMNAGRVPVLEDFKTLEYLTFEHFARKINIPENRIKEFSKTFFSILKSRKDDVKPFPGIIDVLKTLSKEHIIVIITANVKETVQKMMNRYNAGNAISLILDEMDPGDKSDKIIHAMNTFSKDKKSTVMIGDTISDIRYGKKADVITVAVTWGFHSREILNRENPDYIADSPDELFKILHSGIASYA